MSCCIKNGETDMKCKKCHAIFETVPCEHPTGIFDPVVWRDSSWMEYYMRMNKTCPCKDCLINTICIDGKECGVTISDDQIAHHCFYPYR